MSQLNGFASINGLPPGSSGSNAVLTANTFTGVQTVKITDAATNTVTNCIIVSHASSGTAAAAFGTGLKYLGQSSTTADQDMGAVNSVWLVATHASRSSQIQFQTVSNAGALSTGLTVGSGISAATSGVIIGGWSSSAGGIWSSAVTPSVSNHAIVFGSAFTTVNAPSGGTIFCTIAATQALSLTTTAFTFGEALNVVLGTTTGTKIGTATTQKLAFWGSTAVVQQVLATGAGATVDNVITLLQTLGLCKQS